jgi:O-antigen/teichoic acid export membrane protein
VKHNKRLLSLRKQIRANKKLIHNFSFLSILHFFNMILPLITYPYLIGVLGKEVYGLIVYVQAIMAFLVVLIGFGFNISATKEVSIHRNNSKKLSKIVSSVLIIKGILFLLVLVILALLLLVIPKAKGYESLFILTLWMCLYEVVFPIWYFQGTEQMKYITYITMFCRITFLGLIFILIKSPNDYLLVPIINGVGAILAGTSALYIIFGRDKLTFIFPHFRKIKEVFVSSIPFFYSNALVIIKERTNVLIIGMMFSMDEVTYYDLAQKIVEIIRLPFTVVKDTIFPSIAMEKNMLKLKKFYNLSVWFSILINLIIIILSPFIVKLLVGSEMLNAINITRYYSLIIPLSVISMYMGTNIIIFGKIKIYQNSIFISTVSYVLILFFFYYCTSINSYTVITASFLSLITEIIYRNYHIKKQNKK